MDERTTLKQRINALDFALLELNLFLDTHPCDEQAQLKQQEYAQQRAALIAVYEERYGRYVVTAKDACGDHRLWVMGPWPWEYGREC